MAAPHSNDRTRPYRIGALAASFVLLFGLPLSVTVLGPGVPSIVVASVTAVAGFATTSLLLIASQARLQVVRESPRWPQHREETIESTIATLVPTLNLGILLGIAAILVTSVGFGLALLRQPPIVVVDFASIAVASLALILAVHTAFRLRTAVS